MYIIWFEGQKRTMLHQNIGLKNTSCWSSSSIFSSSSASSKSSPGLRVNNVRFRGNNVGKFNKKSTYSSWSNSSSAMVFVVWDCVLCCLLFACLCLVLFASLIVCYRTNAVLPTSRGVIKLMSQIAIWVRKSMLQWEKLHKLWTYKWKMYF